MGGLAGVTGGAITGLVTSSAVGTAVSDLWDRVGNTFVGFKVGAVGAAAVFGTCGAIAGSVCGAVMVYNTAKADIDSWARKHAKETHAANVQIKPTRSAQNMTIQQDGKTYRFVLQNG